MFPAVADPSKTYGAPYTDNTFPFQLFNGALTDGQDAIVILPLLWEADGYRDGFSKWINNEAANAIQIWSDQGVQAAVAGTQLAVISPFGTLETSFGPHLSSGDQFGLAFVPVFGPLVLLNAGSYDRPIGVGANGVSGLGGIASGPVLPRRAVVITREIIEATLNRLATYNPARWRWRYSTSSTRRQSFSRSHLRERWPFSCSRVPRMIWRGCTSSISRWSARRQSCIV